MSRRRRGKHAAAIVGDFMLAPMVAAMRLPMMAQEAQRLSPWRGESMRAITEKMVAVAEGATAAQLTYLRAASSFWPEFFAGRTPALLSGVAAERSVHAALKPASRTIKANFKRLSGKH